jgi:glycosyl transferase family 25
MVHRELPIATILEDDAVFSTDFLHRLIEGITAASRRFDLLYLGRLPQEPDQSEDNGFAVPGYSHCTYGYLLTFRAARLLLAAHLGRALIPVDEFLPAMYLDHPRADVRKRFPPRLRALAFNPPLVHQLPKCIAGSDTEDTDFVSEASLH